jgi:uncharacterized membrane protein YkvA (DUF1232 family)
MNSPVRLRVRLHNWAERLQRDALTLWFAYRHPQAPLGARLLGAFVVAYALSPIDLIPDFIPIIGYLDDLLLLAGLIWLVFRMLPANVLEESRARADQWLAERRAQPHSALGAALVVALWLLCLWLTWVFGKWLWALLYG